jgi:hypothetical protein
MSLPGTHWCLENQLNVGDATPIVPTVPHPDNSVATATDECKAPELQGANEIFKYIPTTIG